MNKLMVVFFGVAFASLHAFADDVELAGKADGDHGGKHFKGGWCRLDLTEEQQAKMRSEKFKFQGEKIDLEAELKHAKLAYRQILSDPKSDYGAAKSAAKDVATSLTKLISAKEGFKAEVAFKILTAEQRKEAEKCHRGRPHGFHTGFGPGRGERMGFEEDSAAPSEAEFAISPTENEFVAALDDEDVQ